MHLFAAMFLGTALVTVIATFLIVGGMVHRLKQVASTKRRIASIFLELPGIICEHNRLFPRSGTMLALWLLLIYVLAWLSGLVFSLAVHL